MWTQIIDELLGSGMNLRQLSERSGVPASTISELRNGITIDPKWSTGCKLMVIHDQVTGGAHQEPA